VGKTYIGIDNGVSGSVAAINDEKVMAWKTPVKKELSYTKAKQYISRVEFLEIRKLLADIRKDMGDGLVLLERPMVNPMRFKASVSALRCLEATLISLELSGFAFQYVDSKEWQRVMLPSGLIDQKERKNASRELCKRLFPELEMKGIPDGDAVLMAEWARRANL